MESCVLKRLICGLVLGVLANPLSSHAQAERPGFEVRRCVNMGNALEAPNEGEWGYSIEAWHFARIRSAGFDTIRLPVFWSGHMDTQDGRLDPAFLARTDEVINAALAADLNILLDVHHFTELMEHPEENMERFRSLWRQLATHYRDLPDRVAFEVLNEPNGALRGALMREAQASAVEIIRAVNPERVIVLGGENWSNVETLGTNLASDDPNVIYTFHYYDPFDFTHQKAEWTGPDGPKERRGWGAAADRDALKRDMQSVRDFVTRTGRAVFLGEFGAYEKAPIQDRLRYTGAVRLEAESVGLGWCVWNFASGFPIFDVTRDAWEPGYPEALGLTVE